MVVFTVSVLYTQSEYFHFMIFGYAIVGVLGGGGIIFLSYILKWLGRELLSGDGLGILLTVIMGLAVCTFSLYALVDQFDNHYEEALHNQENGFTKSESWVARQLEADMRKNPLLWQLEYKDYDGIYNDRYESEGGLEQALYNRQATMDKMTCGELVDYKKASKYGHEMQIYASHLIFHMPDCYDNVKDEIRIATKDVEEKTTLDGGEESND